MESDPCQSYISIFFQNNDKCYKNDVFIASAISNIFQNYNYCSLEMEKLSTDISIAKNLPLKLLY